jgi:two-component system OmpR family response regulator
LTPARTTTFRSRSASSSCAPGCAPWSAGGSQARPAILQVGTLRLDPASRRAWRAEAPITLSATEFALLELFMRHPGEVLTRSRILEHVWDFAYDAVSNVVDQYVGYLRRKIDRPFGREDLETVRGAGYRLRQPGE